METNSQKIIRVTKKEPVSYDWTTKTDPGIQRMLSYNAVKKNSSIWISLGSCGALPLTGNGKL